MDPHSAGRYGFGQRRLVAITGHKPLFGLGGALAGREAGG